MVRSVLVAGCRDLVAGDAPLVCWLAGNVGGMAWCSGVRGVAWRVLWTGPDRPIGDRTAVRLVRICGLTWGFAVFCRQFPASDRSGMFVLVSVIPV